MRITPPDISLRKDSRGVSEVVGFLLIFALLIILLSINQAQFVPQENSEVEFQHFQDVQDDMVDVRSAISDAGQNNESQYPTVQLGTNYPTRLFAVNPPPPAGSLRTSQEYNISIYDDPGSDTPTENVSTRFLEYQNGYNELNVGSIWYENSVLYLDEPDTSGNTVIIEDQNIVPDNSDSVRVTALKNDYSENSAGRVTIEFYPVEDVTTDLDSFDGKIKLEIPTRLKKEYWDDELADYDGYDGAQFNTNDGMINSFNLTVDTDSLRFNTVGINSQPEGDQSSVRDNIAREAPPEDKDRSGDRCKQDSGLVFDEVLKGDGGVVYFSIDSVASKDILVTDMSIDATSIKNNPQVNGDKFEVVTANTEAEGIENKYDADGTIYQLDPSALITAGETEVEINIRIGNNFKNLDLKQTNSNDRKDVSVTLYSNANTEYTFCFEDIS